MKLNIVSRINLLCALTIVIFLANYAVVFIGIYGNDDITYIKLAHRFSLTNSLDLQSTNHFQHRWLAIVVTGIFYRLFGINVYTSSIFCMTCCLLTAFCICKYLKKENRIILLTALCLFLFNYEILFQSHRLLADSAIALIVFVAYCIYQNIKNNNCISNSKKVLYSFMFSTILMLGVITKETIYITLLLWVYLFFCDIKNKRLNLFWLCVIIIFVAQLFLYLLVYKLNTGEWFYRLNILHKNNSFSSCRFDLQPVIETVKRLTYGLLDSFLMQGYMLIFLPAICSFFYRKKLFSHQDKLQQLSTAFLILLLAANFMSLSVKSYLPLCADSRHFMFLIPFATILSSYMLYYFFQKPFNFFLLPVLFLVADFRLLFCNLGYTKLIYFFLTIILIIAYLLYYLKSTKKYTYFLTSLFVLIFSVKGLSTFVIEPYPFYFSQKNIVENIIQKNEESVVFCNSLETVETSEFILHFNDLKTKFVELKQENIDKLVDDKKVYFLVNNAFDLKASIKLHQQLNGKFNYIQKENVYLYEIQKNDLYFIKSTISKIN